MAIQKRRFSTHTRARIDLKFYLQTTLPIIIKISYIEI